MAECLTCKKTLQGSWNMYGAGAPYDKTGRYLGITDGYFLYSELPNWVYCYCQPCWQKNILTLSFVPKAEQLNTLQQQNTSLQQQLNASQQNEANLQQQLNTLQDQLTSARTESASHKKQLDEMSEIYNKFVTTSGIEQLRDLFKQLTSSQIDALHMHTSFRIDTFEAVYGEQQLQCSTQFVQSILKQLKSSVDAVIQHQKNALTQGKQAKESVIQTLTNAGMSKAVLDASVKLLETEIEQIETGIEGWSTFSAVSINIVNQPSSVEEMWSATYDYSQKDYY